jgi:hypothetical protein
MLLNRKVMNLRDLLELCAQIPYNLEAGRFVDKTRCCWQLPDPPLTLRPAIW